MAVVVTGGAGARQAHVRSRTSRAEAGGYRPHAPLRVRSPRRLRRCGNPRPFRPIFSQSCSPAVMAGLLEPACTVGTAQPYDYPMVIRPSLLFSAALAAAALSAGCGSSATTATSPSSISRCSVTVSTEGQVPAQGGTSRLTVSAARECAWNASVEGQWLTIKAGATGQGDGTVEITAVANPDPQVRRGTAVVNERRVDVMQAAGECSYSLSEPSSSFAQAGGSGVFDVRASSQLCAWTVISDSSWI